MSLLKKTLLVVASVVVISTISLYFASRLTLLHGYEKIEQDDMRANVLRTVNSFDDQAKSLNHVARGYAFWDDMYRFVEQPDPAFLDALGLTPDLFAAQKANLFAILDVSNQPVLLKMVDLETLEPLEIPTTLANYLKAGSALLNHSTDQPEISGVILLDGKPMYVASLATLHTDFTGEPQGAVIIGRYVDQQVITNLANATQLVVAAYGMDDPRRPPDVQAAHAALQSLPDDTTVYVNSLSTNEIAGYTYVQTLDDQPAFILKVQMPRSIYAQGLTSFRYFAVLAALAGLCFIAVTMLLLRRLVLSPLTWLNQEISAIRASGDDAQRVQVHGHDELTSLSLTINGMLDELEKQSEERYRTLVENINDVIFALDADGRFTYISPAIEHMKSYTADEIIGQAFEKFVHPDDLPGLQLSLQRMLAGELEPHEFRAIRKDGQLLYVRTHSRLLWQGGQVVGLTGTMTDITRRKQAELALIESQQYLAAVFNSINDAIFVHDATGKILDVNQTACQLYGYSRATLLGLDIAALSVDQAPYSQTEALHWLQKAREAGPQLFEWYAKTSTGQTFWAEINIRHAHIADDERFFVTVRDISDRKQVEAEREKLIGDLEARNMELERFTYTVSHDLKAPLITIRGFLGLLEQDVRTGQLDHMKSDMQRIVDATQKMQRLLSELLELSRVGRLMNPPEDVPFELIVRDALAATEGHLAARGITCEVAPELPVVRGDRARLVEVMQNLLDNAAKFMGPQPQPHLTIGTQGTDRDGNPILFVADNGIGIAPAYHERIFGLFDKLDPRSEGTGIGLALVKRIMEVHNGRIWVESAGDGQGSTFYLLFPKATEPSARSL